MSETFKRGQVWLWAGQFHCMLIRYVKYDWAARHEVWDVLALDSEEPGALCRGHLHSDVATGDGSKWERVA